MNKKKNKFTLANPLVFGKSEYYMATEAYIRLKDNLYYVTEGGKKKVIQIESSVPNEGKTTTVINLALALANDNKKVLICDFDLSKSNINRALQLSNEDGICEIIKGIAKKENIFKKTSNENIDVLVRGGAIVNHAIVFENEGILATLAEAREKYDYILCDCPPVLASSDYLSISKVTDGVLFLVAYGATKKRQVTEAFKQLELANIKVLASVFTQVDKKFDSMKYGYYYQK